MPKSFLEAASDILNGAPINEEVVKQPPQKLPSEVRDMGSEGPPGDTAGKKASADAKKIAAPKGPASEGGPEGGKLPAEIKTVDAKTKNLGEEAEEDEDVVVVELDDNDLEDEVLDEEVIEEDADEEGEEVYDDEDEVEDDEEEISEEVELSDEEIAEGKKVILADLVDAHMGSVSEDVDALFQGEEGLSEDFKKKAAAIFEGAVRARVLLVTEEVSDALDEVLVEQVEGISSTLSEQVDNYLKYVVEEWSKENEIAIESGLRTEITEEFIGGLKTLFQEHNIEIPEDKVNIVEELALANDEAQEKLNAVLNENITLRKQLDEQKKVAVFNSICENLTVSQVEKLKSLTEGVEFTTEGEYKEKLTVIRENYFPATSETKTDVVATPENTDGAKDVQAEEVDPIVKAVADSITRTTALRRL